MDLYEQHMLVYSLPNIHSQNMVDYLTTQALGCVEARPTLGGEILV